MDVLDCIKKRRSIKRYLESPVEWDKIVKILEAGKAAPSSGNLQNWKFIVVKDKGTRELIAEACYQQYWMNTAPVHIVVCSVNDAINRFYGLRGEKLYAIQNCAAAIQNMLLEATELSLGTCWVGAFEEDLLNSALGIDGARAQAVITLGYADETPPEPPEFPLEFVCFLEKYGNKIGNVDILFKDYSVAIKKGIDNSSEFLTEKGKKFLHSVKKRIEDKIDKKTKN